jgi:hypothetical protein
VSTPAEQMAGDALARQQMQSQALPPQQPSPRTPTDLGQNYLDYRSQLPAQAAGEQLKQQQSAASTVTGAIGTGLKAVGAVAGDIGKGVFLESGPAVYTGARNAVQNTYDKLDDLAGWATQKMGLENTGIPIPGTDRNVSDIVKQWIDKKEVADPTSTTGKLIQGVAQFVTGLALTKGIAPGGAGALAGSARGAESLAVAFDPHQANLSNLVEQFPSLSNPVTRLLQAKPDDTTAEGMAKKAFEGMGLGVLSDGLVKGIRTLASAKEGGELMPREAPAKPGLPDDAFGMLGDAKVAPGEPILQQAVPAAAKGISPADLQTSLEKGAPEQVPSSAAGREMEPPKTFINFARIDAPDDVKRAMQEIADAREAPADSAKAGVMSFEDIKANAAQQDAWNILKARREGDPLPAPQMYAARQLWLSSAEKTVEVARTVQQAPTEENMFALRKMLEVHGWIGDQVTGARAAAARSMGQMRIPVGTPESRLSNVTDMLDQLGGTETTRDIANRVVALADSTDKNAPLALDLFSQKSAYARGRDAVVQLFRDSLLSSPTTQGAILASNVSTALWRMGVRKVGEGVSSLLDTTGGVAPGEAQAMWSGWIGSFKDAMAYGWKSAQSGEMGHGIGEGHEAFPSNLSADALNLTGTVAGKIADFVGQAASWGFGMGGRRMIVAQHDMALTMAYGSALHANAVRQAAAEIGAGSLAQEGAAERVAELLHGPDGLPDESIAAPARAEAKYQAFLDDPGKDTLGKLTQIMLDARKQIPALNAVIPFLKIPSRITSFTFENTPLAPLMSDFRAKVAAGGATRDLALAQLAVGNMVTSSAADMVFSHTLKGGGLPQKGLEQAQEREGESRDSIKIGDTWYHINRIHPIGKAILLAADVAETFRDSQHQLLQDEDTIPLVSGTALSIARTLTNASYMQGLSDLFATLHDAKVSNKSEGEAAIQSMVGSVVPQASAAIARSLDPYQRAVYSMLDEFKSKMPGLSQTLPPRRDLWGDPISSGHDAFTRLASPVQFQKETHTPIDDEIQRLGANITPPERVQSFGGGRQGPGVRIDLGKDPQMYSRFLELAGHGTTMPEYNDMGAKDYLNALVAGNAPLSPLYSMKSDSAKAEMIRGIVNHFREGARGQLMSENPKLENQVNEMRAQMQALKMPQ